MRYFITHALPELGLTQIAFLETLISQNLRMAWVERDLKDHQVPTPCHRQSCQLLDQALDQIAQGPIQPALKPLQGSPFQHLTTLLVKKFLNFPLTSDLNLPSFSLKKKNCSCPITIYLCKKFISPMFINSF